MWTRNRVLCYLILLLGIVGTAVFADIARVAMGNTYFPALTVLVTMASTLLTNVLNMMEELYKKIDDLKRELEEMKGKLNY